jgi:hypothetical protein
LPPYSLPADQVQELGRQAELLARSIGVIGLMNVQFAIKDGVVYILEVNPRASRTVPFVAKAIGLPVAKIAARVMAGEKLADLLKAQPKVSSYLTRQAVKTPVFPFARFPGADTLLGPEMRSTGEVMGLDLDFAGEGVKSLTFRENVSSDPMTVDDVTLVPHSIYVCIDGGDDMAIAVAMLRKKSIGAGWNGDVEVNVVEPYSGQTYLVKFARPVIQQIYARVTIRAPETLSDPAKAVRDAIVSYAQGDIDGEPGFVVGGSVSGFELAAAVNMVDPSIFVKDVQIATDPDGPYGYETIPILISQKANIYSGAIQVNLL